MIRFVENCFFVFSVESYSFKTTKTYPSWATWSFNCDFFSWPSWIFFLEVWQIVHIERHLKTICKLELNSTYIATSLLIVVDSNAGKRPILIFWKIFQIFLMRMCQVLVDIILPIRTIPSRPKFSREHWFPRWILYWFWLWIFVNEYYSSYTSY